jgi:hypothetical protein
MRANPGKSFLLVAAALVIAAVLVPVSAVAGDRGSGPSGVMFHDLKSQTEAFIGYFKNITLTPEELEVRNEALASIPAPCCDNFSAATCCCVCNLARSIWGLSNYLIQEEGYSAEKVRGMVNEWLDFTNPVWYSGNACFNGGCGRPFYRDGCGGMEEGNLVI